MKTQKAANLVRLRKDLQQLDAELKLAISQLPEKREIPDLLSSISAKAQQSGLDVLLFRPRVETFQDFYAEIPVDITVKGSFQNTVSFFDEVGHLAGWSTSTTSDLKIPRSTATRSCWKRPV